MPEPQASSIEQLFLPQLLNTAFSQMMDRLQGYLVANGYDDLRPTHFMNVFRLMDCDGARPTELARRAGMTPQAMGELVTHLEKRGYVERVADPADGRVRIVVLAERGRAAAEVADAFFAELEDGWASVLGQEGLDQLKRSFTAVLEQPAAPAPPTTPRPHAASPVRGGLRRSAHDPVPDAGARGARS